MFNNSRVRLINIVLLSIFSISLHANDLITNYRINGIEGIEKQMDLELTKEAYWNSYLKDKDTTFGYLESYSSVLTCDKSTSSLEFYKEDEHQTFKLKKKYNAFTGKLKGDKEKEGDLKTPIGVYNLTKKLSNVDSFYGPMAFVTSYPNSYDQYKGREGHGIWIHGLPVNQERDDFTKGCIAINNSSIECLDKNINIEKTILIINNSEVKKNTSKEVLSAILSQLYLWRYSWIYNLTDVYLSFYADDFVRSDGMNLERFKKYKTRVFNKLEKKTILFNNINVIPYPNHENTYEVTFKELYTSNSFTFSGDKTLMITMGSNNKIKIFTEK
jgi:murein L,D-transpeptidase YafK